jgi:hypothetical protein
MKSFVFFIILNVLTLFAHAQDQTTCEQMFSLQNKTCTPCQRALFTQKAMNPSFAEMSPENCLVFDTFLNYISDNTTTTPDTPDIPFQDDVTKVKEALDKTCAENVNSQNLCEKVGNGKLLSINIISFTYIYNTFFFNKIIISILNYF